MSQHLTEPQFDKEVLQSSVPVFVDFYAEWCGPCKAIAPIVEELALEYKDTVKVFKVDVDAEGGLASRYGVMSIPTMFFFKGGKPVDQLMGGVSKSELKAKFEAILSS